MAVDILSELFSSAPLVKIIRLFFLNPGDVFDIKEIGKRTKVHPRGTRTEIKLLEKIGLIKKDEKQIEVEIKQRSSKKNKTSPRKTKTKKIKGWSLNSEFPLFRQLKNLILNAEPVDRPDIVKKFRALGKVKLLILSGIFIQEDNSRVDIMIVGDDIKTAKLESALKSLEAEIGKELSYAYFNTEEFTYRLDMYDRFLRDILDYPHETLLNKLGV